VLEDGGVHDDSDDNDDDDDDVSQTPEQLLLTAE